MDTSDHIVHEGIVTDKVNDKMVVHVLQASGCHSCHMRGYCGVEDEDRNRFEVSDSGLEVGDKVHICISPASGFKATFWAYFFPFLLMVAVIIVGAALSVSEAVSGSVALLLLVPYYIILSLSRSRISNQVRLHISKL